MAKFKTRLPKKEIDKILYQLCMAISETRNPKEAAELLRDLLSYQEAEMIAKRLKIAELVSQGMTYEEIEEELKVSPSTIARVQEWMRISGEGYRQAISNTRGKIKKDADVVQTSETWSSIKRKYPQYYWPEMVLEKIVVNSNKKQKAQLQAVIGSMDKSKEKTELYRRLKRLIS